MIFQGIPVLGQDASGQPLNMVMDSTGKSNTAGFVETVGGTSPSAPSTTPQPSTSNAWHLTQVTSISKSSSGLVAIGYGADNTGSTSNIAWIYNESSWKVGPSGTNSVRSIGIAHDGTNYVVADGSSIKVSNFVLGNLSPAGGYASAPPTYVSVSSSADAVVKGSVVIGSSLSANGVWVGPSWSHEAGLPVLVPTGHYSTTYTFPGASGSNLQIQIVKAIPNGDNLPTTWGDDSINSKGYYGLINSPSVKVEWPEVA